MEKKGSTVSFHNVNYTVQVKSDKCCSTQGKEIIQNVSGIFKPGMNAILGPTGSGKTSLLDILAGRKEPEGLEGTILIDGKPQPKNFKCLSGYVVQDDVVMGTLTVRENFMFSASLRLPASTPVKEKEERVNTVIQELGLDKCADTKVGTEFIRGVSGGERKRTNIGMELIISPSILFLDEPTTGLDASTANAVMRLLKGMASRGKTIIFSIHQPRYSIYKLFDQLVLLSLGRTVYHGPSHEALEYFEQFGYVCEEHNNPSDFFLDVINGDSSALQGDSQQEVTKFGGEVVTYTNNGVNGSISHNKVANFESDGIKKANGSTPNTHMSVTMLDIDEDGSTQLAEELNQNYTKSQWYTSTQKQLEPIYNEYKTAKTEGVLVEMAKGEYQTGFGSQFGTVSKRQVINIIRNPQTSIMQMFVMVVFALIVGVIYFKVDNSATTGIQNRVGAFFFIVMNQMFGNLSSVELFIKERAIFIHENASGFYRVSVFFVSKVFCDVIPLRAIPVLIFSSIVYFMIGFAPGADKFFIFVLDLFLTGLTAASIGFVISASVRIFAVANLLIALSFVFMMVFSGLLVNLDTIAPWLRWIQWLSVFRYSMKVLNINELKDMEFCIDLGNGTSYCDPDIGNEYLESQGIAYKTQWDLWQNILALAGMSLLFLILSYVQLRRVKKLK